jgi:hypothetical protein
MSKEEIARDGQELIVRTNGQIWSCTWHSPSRAPAGTAHGSCGYCVTGEGGVVLISQDQIRWTWPGGRPEGDETWEETFRREVLKETCCPVRQTRLLGFFRSACRAGPEKGLVLVRSVWRGDVDLLPCVPLFEVKWRKVVPALAVICEQSMEQGLEPGYRRAMLEAGLSL